MTTVLDYSTGFPGAAAIIGAGYIGAVRYIGLPGNPKCTTREELNDFTANLAGMALVFEQNRGDWRKGFNGGYANAQKARWHADDIGFPPERPIYMAIDDDLTTEEEFGIALGYLEGAMRALGGPEFTGVYGEGDVINRAREHGFAAFFWQTSAWSHHIRVEANLYQYVGGLTVNRVSCDGSQVLSDDWGQHIISLGGNGGTSMSSADTDRIIKALNEGATAGLTGPQAHIGTWAAELRMSQRIVEERLAAILNALAGVARMEETVNRLDTTVTQLTGAGVSLTASGEIIVTAHTP